MDLENGELNRYALGGSLIDNDGCIGIPFEYTVLFDTENFEVKRGFGGTPIMLYVVNTNTERIGTLSDRQIVFDMLARGYIVIVLDYLGNDKATSPKLDLSVQGIRQRVINGELLADIAPFCGGSYPETLVVPSGYDVSYGNVFWEFDKHGADGTLEKIVEIWNNDFRGTNSEKIIKWTDSNGNRKKTQCDHDGSAPIWYNASGDEDESGEYVKIKHTLARDIRDCVKPDGSPVDLKLYMHLLYPTKPLKKVPVMCLSSSAENLCAGSATPDRPHMNGFLFNGYAGVLYDFGYTPMARSDHYGYFDGYPRKGYVTGDNATYSMKHYNDFSDTAAMRYIRYLALSDGRFCFDTNAIGVYGNSKGAWMTFLGEENPDAMPSRRMFAGHSGETRFENGDTQARDGINGGEAQPWLSYNGKEIFGGANFVYSGCGATYFNITKGHSPMFVCCNRRDESCFTTSNAMVNLGRAYDIPTMWLEVPLGHTLVHDDDLLYGIDSYQAFFDFVGYYLKNDDAKVVGAKVNRYTFPASVTVMFSGSINADEAAKITLCDVKGKFIPGNLTSCYGGIEWTFTPSDVCFGKGFTLRVPHTLVGENGKMIQSGFIYDVDFGEGYVTPIENDLEVDEAADRRYIAFRVENDGVNTVSAYIQDGSCIGSVNTSGCGWYKIDVTSKGEIKSKTLTLKSERREGVTLEKFKPSICGNANGDESYMLADKEVIAVSNFNTCTKYPTEEFYSYPAQALKCDGFIKSKPLDEGDIGRRFRISFKVYDTTSRYISFGLNSCSSRPSGVADYHRVILNELTEKCKWKEYGFDYTVYEPIFGQIGMQEKSFYINCFGSGNKDTPIYFTDFRLEETVNEVVIGKKYVVYESGQKPLNLGESDIECPKSPWSK